MRLLISGLILFMAQGAYAADSCNIDAIIKQAWPDAQSTARGVVTPGKQLIKTQNESPLAPFVVSGRRIQSYAGCRSTHGTGTT